MAELNTITSKPPLGQGRRYVLVGLGGSAPSASPSRARSSARASRPRRRPARGRVPCAVAGYNAPIIKLAQEWTTASRTPSCASRRP